MSEEQIEKLEAENKKLKEEAKANKKDISTLEKDIEKLNEVDIVPVKCAKHIVANCTQTAHCRGEQK